MSVTTFGQTAIVIILNSDLNKYKTPNQPCYAVNWCFLVWLRPKDYVTIDKLDYLGKKWFIEQIGICSFYQLILVQFSPAYLLEIMQILRYSKLCDYDMLLG